MFGEDNHCVVFRGEGGGRGEGRGGEGEKSLPDKADFFVQLLLAEEGSGSSVFSYISQG